MKLVLTTQYLENYGAHDWDGVGECPQYWKAKGGEVYVVEGFSWAEYEYVRDVLSKEVISLVESKDEYSETYVISWSMEEDDAVLWNSWEEPVIFYKADGVWMAKRVSFSVRRGVGVKYSVTEWVVDSCADEFESSVAYYDENDQIVPTNVVYDRCSKQDAAYAAGVA